MTYMKKKSQIILPAHKTKIVCTIGPASRSPQVLKKMITSGMTVARLNFSHGTLEQHRRDIRQIRRVASGMNRPVSIMIDLPGSKIRVGTLHIEPILLKKGEIVALTIGDNPCDSHHIPIDYKQLPESVSKGSIVYLNDGFITLRVNVVDSNGVQCRVVNGGPVFSHKGVNLPGAKLFVESVTEKDLRYVSFGLRENVHIFGASFIKNANDVRIIKEYAEKKGVPVHVIAKIERREAVKNFDAILKAADGIMIARGDLGMEIPIEDVPVVQKQLIRRANLAGLPVITATQMLESMTENSRPTRAEVTDVANAILDGTDAVMLSEETAIGKYPLEAVQMMAKIATSIERRRNGVDFRCNIRESFTDSCSETKLSVADVISLNVVEAAEILDIRYILTTTESGSTARRISRFKPGCWILSFSKQKETVEFLPLSYGVYPIYLYNRGKSWHDPILRFMKTSGLVTSKDKVILTQRRFARQKGGTDSFGILSVGNHENHGDSEEAVETT